MFWTSWPPTEASGRPPSNWWVSVFGGVRYRNRTRVAEWIRIHFIRIQHFFQFFFISKTAIYLSLGLHKERPSYRRSLQLSKENIQHLKTWNFFNFFSSFVGHFCPPGSGSGFLIRIHWPDWIRIQLGSGSATLNRTNEKLLIACFQRLFHFLRLS